MTMRSSTQLRNFRLADLHVEFNDEWLWTPEEGHCPEEYDVSPKFEVFSSPHEGDVLIKLSLVCAPAAGAAGACRFRTVAATVWGILGFTDEVEREERERRVFLNGPVMLHGLLRGILASATGSCAGGPFVLPTVNYVEVLRRQAAQPQLPCSDETDDGETGPRAGERPRKTAPGY
jgi:hypothetical protein